MTHASTLGKTRSHEILERCRAIEGGGLRTFVDDDPLVWQKAYGWTIEDADGNRYLDLYGGFAVAAIGHSHPAVVSAVTEQMKELSHCPSAHASPVRAAFLETLSSIAPPGSTRLLPAVTGAMANEIALAIARTRRPGRFITFTGTYLGRSAGVVGLAGKAHYRDALGIEAAGEFAPFPYPLRMGPDAVDTTMDHLDRSASKGGPISAVVVEPVQGNGGVVIPPADFLPRLRAFCDRVGALLIVDEIQSGCGRTGLMWAIEHSGVTPDLMTVGKGIGGGLAVAAVLGQQDTMVWPPDTFTSTFLTNNVNLAASVAAMTVLRDEGLVDRARDLGARTLPQLDDLAALSSVAEVRRIGLWAGIELVQPNGDPAPERAAGVVRELRSRGIIVGKGGHDDNVVKISPPLVIGEQELSAAIATVNEVINEAD